MAESCVWKYSMRCHAPELPDGRRTFRDRASEPRPYAGLDMLKLFFAACVVAIHTYALEELPESAYFWISQGILRMAVPFFFMASGFLLGRKLESMSAGQAVAGYVKGFLPWLLAVGTANAVLGLWLRHLRYGTGLAWLVFDFARHFLFYPYGAMWFLQACAVGAAMLYPFLRRGKLDLALAVGALLYVWALLCNNYYFLAQAAGFSGFVDAYMAIFISGRNGVFVGFFFLAMGIMAWRWRVKIGKPSAFALAACAAAYLLEIYLLKDCGYADDRALYVSQPALAAFLVLCAARLELPISGRIAVWMRNMSTWLYYSHRLVYVFGRIVCFMTLGTDWRGTGTFVAVMSLCVLAFFVGGERLLRLSPSRRAPLGKEQS